MRILNFGKNSGKALDKCEESYILWIAQHEKCLHPDNRWASKLALEILTAPGQEAQVCLQLINTTYQCLFFAKYRDDKKKFQADLESRINYMKEQYGYTVIEKYHKYIFA